MKQLDKLRDLLREPRKYGTRKGTRVYHMLEELAALGRVRTGASSKGYKRIDTFDVVNVLNRAGIACTYGNDAPRGGANGEWVALTGQVAKDVKKAYQCFTEAAMISSPGKYSVHEIGQTWGPLFDGYLDMLKK